MNEIYELSPITKTTAKVSTSRFHLDTDIPFAFQTAGFLRVFNATSSFQRHYDAIAVFKFQWTAEFVGENCVPDEASKFLHLKLEVVGIC